METKYTKEQIAADWYLWVEYFDTDGTMTREEFDAMSEEDRVQLMTDAGC